MKQALTLPKLQFEPITPALRQRYLSVIGDRCRDADHAFANLYIWNEAYHQSLAFAKTEEGTRVIVRFCDGTGHCRHLFPVGEGSPLPVVEAMRQLAHERGEILSFSAVTKEQIAELESVLPNAFSITEERDIADYLYDAESLATLAGKKLHGKRNHINAFAAAHGFALLPLTPEHFDACRAIEAAWLSEHAGDSAEREQVAVERAFAAFDTLELEGALLMADGEPAAFTIGSMLTSDTLCVHVEKALSNLNGAYPTINREFVRMMREKHPALRTVNREDDMGLENLRRAKLSYRPAELLTKYTLTEITNAPL
ncbi:MAG: DUF2156 domain-containing protein [Clostridia bacterium]|nr:DUF2156 domain-containing protein [Clostridia bacterium]